MSGSRPSMKEIEDFFKDEECKKLPKISFNEKEKCMNNDYVENTKPKYDFSNTTRVSYSGYEHKIDKSQTFSFENKAESLFKEKMKEHWTFDLQFRLIEGEAIFIAVAYLKGEKKLEGCGKSLEEVYNNLFKNEEY